MATLSLAVLTLTACDKKPAESEQTTNPAPTSTSTETTAPADTAVTQPATPADNHAHAHGDHAHGDHAHGEHGHQHHHEGDAYQCGDKTVSIVVHNHEGEVEAHATIDDIEYDMPQDATKPNHYVSPQEGLNNQGMAMQLDGNKATFKSLDGKVLLDCQKSM